MKMKSLFGILIVMVILLAYNVFCYAFANKMIEKGSRNVINNYFKNVCSNCEAKYIKATSNDDSSINVFVNVDSNKAKKEYYRFVLLKSNDGYSIKEVNNDIPVYIR